MKIEIEKPASFTPSVLATLISVSIGSLFMVSSGLWIGLLAFLITFIAIQRISDLTNSPLPNDARACAEAAIRHFKSEHSDAQIVSVALRDTTEERLIISIKYERLGIYSIPTSRMYYAVKRDDKTVTQEEGSKWWSKGLK